MHYTVSTEFGGLIGSVGWAGFFLICTYFGETYFSRERKEFYIAVGGSAIVAALFALGFFLTKDGDILTDLAARFFTLNRLMYSAFYLFLTLFTSLVCFAFFDLVSRDKKFMFLTAWGEVRFSSICTDMCFTLFVRFCRKAGSCTRFPLFSLWRQ